MGAVKYRICSNCVMDTSDPNIKFDKDGVCDRCNAYYRHILPAWNHGIGREQQLNHVIKTIKNHGKGKPYDCILGLSGGVDSSYLLHLAVKEFGLRPLVFHVDSGWDADFTKRNIMNLTDRLGVELKVEVLNWEEMRDFQLAMFKSGVPHLDIPQDMAFVSVLDKYALNNHIKFILNGGNVSTEVVVNPSSWGYWGTDMIQVNDIIKKFGTVPMKTYPFTNIFIRKLVLPYIKGVKVVKLLNYVQYIKKEAEELLKREYDFEPYPQKHFESILTKFIEGYWLPKRFGYDIRRAQFSSLILTGQMTREEALERLKDDPIPREEVYELIKLVATKLEISEDELMSYMRMALKSYKDYKNIKFIFDIGSKILFYLGIDSLVRR